MPIVIWCNKCGFGFLNETDLNNHKLQAHGEKIEVKRKVSSIPKSDNMDKPKNLETKVNNRVSNFAEFLWAMYLPSLVFLHEKSLIIISSYD